MSGDGHACCAALCKRGVKPLGWLLLGNPRAAIDLTDSAQCCGVRDQSVDINLEFGVTAEVVLVW